MGTAKVCAIGKWLNLLLIGRMFCAVYCPGLLAAVAMAADVVRVDPALDALIDADAQIEVLADGFDWSEGPVWIRDGEYLVFNDIPPNKAYKWSEKGGLEVYLEPAGFTGDEPRGGEQGANGLALDRAGRLLLCQHGDRRVARMEAPTSAPRPEFVTLASHYEGHRLNSPNDLIVHSSGAIYFTDPPYGLEGNVNDPAKELDFQGVYRISPAGAVTLVSKELPRPNGIGLSPDESKLYVANSDGRRPIWMVFDVQDDGTLENERVFFNAAELAKSGPGGPDGLKIDEQGNLFATGPGGVVILSPEGKHLGTILAGLTANCAFGDDGRTLYMTSDDKLQRIRLKTKGLGWQ
jgi:gluconolactonase